MVWKQAASADGEQEKDAEQERKDAEQEKDAGSRLQVQMENRDRILGG